MIPEQYDEDRTQTIEAQATSTLTRFVWIGGEFIEADAVETGGDGEETR